MKLKELKGIVTIQNYYARIYDSTELESEPRCVVAAIDYLIDYYGDYSLKFLCGPGYPDHSRYMEITLIKE